MINLMLLEVMKWKTTGSYSQHLAEFSTQGLYNIF